MTRFARLAALCAGIAMSACTCAPEKPPLPEKRVDSLFAFDEDAFAFANFGGRGSGSAMNAAMLERLHGKADICDPTSTECRLTPLAKEYMRSVNDAMEGGRCEGFAVLSGLMASGDVDVTTFGGNGGRELTLEGNRALGAEIAYWFTTQYLTEVVFDSTQTLSGEDTVRFLAQVYSAGAAAPYRLGIVRIDEGGFMTGGHAILATGVGPGEADGQYFIYVYDNNLPDAEQKIVVDVNAGTWEYVASTNPDDPAALYSGTPDNGNVLFVAALSPRRGQHPCAFCSSEASLQQVFGSAGAVVAVEDDSGARTGEVDGRIVDEVAGSRTVPLVSANNTDRVGTMTVMPSQGVTMTVSQGEPGAPASVRLLAPDLVIAAEDLTFGEDGSGEAVLQTNEDGSDVSFAPADGGGGASLTVGSTGEDGTQTVMSVTVPEGEAVGAIEITTGEDGNPTVAVDGDGETTIEIEVTREGPEGADSFTGSVEVPDGGAATLLVDEWAEGDGELGAEIDEDGDGQGDQTVVVEETEPLVPPAAPTGLTATAQGQERIALSWQDNATDEIAYEVERDDGAGFARIAVLAPDTVDYVDSGLTPATTYRYRVRATAAEAVSDYSDVVTATTDAIVLFTVGGSVRGLRGTLVLGNRGTGEELTVDADGPFVFSTAQNGGTTFDVAVVRAPAEQRCTVEDGLGIVLADVTDVVVTCVDTFTVGGVVRGLRSGGLVLQNNGVDPLPIDADGEFTFATRVDLGDRYAVAVRRQAPGYECVVQDGAGVISASVTDVVVLCAPTAEPTFTLAVTVTGLPSQAGAPLVLQNNGAEQLRIDADGTHPFLTPLLIDDAYEITVVEEPAGFVCTVADGAGVAPGDVTVAVSCVRVFRVGGTVAGLNTGNSLTLVLQDTTTVTATDNGAFTFPGFFPVGTPVASVAVQTAPADQRCTVAHPTGIVSDADVLDIAVTCVDTFVVGGTLTAPAGAAVTIANTAGTDTITVAGDAGTFAFARRFDVDEAYAVTASGTDLTCTVTNGTGTVQGTVDTIAVVCVDTVSISVSVTGLVAAAATGLVLQNNGGDDLPVDTDAVLPFATLLGRGDAYAVTVQQQPTGASCSVVDGAGTADGDIVVDVVCNPLFRIGGTVAGLNTGNSITLVLQDTTIVTVSDNGAFTFPGFFPAGTSVASVAVQTAPADERCTVARPTGTVSDADVLDIAVTCIDTFVVGGTLTAPPGASVTIANTAGTDTVTVAGNAVTFAFARRFDVDEAYAVTASGTDLLCSVTNGTGTVQGTVDTIAVVCVDTVSVSASVTGLTATGATGLVLQNNGGDDRTVNGDGVVAFPTLIGDGSAYAVTVSQQPTGASCAVTAGGGTAAGDVVVNVVCSPLFRVGGTVAGLNTGNSVTLVLQDTTTVTVTDNGAFTFPGFFPAGTSVASVAVQTAPVDERCTVARPTGAVSDADVLDIAVTCIDTFPVGGTLTAPAGASVTIANTVGNDTVTVAGDAGTFTFARRFDVDENYAVTAAGTGLLCSVVKGVDVVRAAVTNIAVTCVGSISVSASVTGLTATSATGLVLQNNGSDDLAVGGDGVVAFSTLIGRGTPYAVTVAQQPAGALCSVSNGSGTADANVVVDVACQQAYRIGGTATGLNAGNALTLELVGGPSVTLTDNGPFTFPGFFATGTSVALTSTLIELSDERCSVVSRPAAQVGSADVLDLAVSCVDTFVVGGTLTAPVAASVTIANTAGSDSVTVPGDAGTFAFARRFAVGEDYVVDASGADILCTVTDGQGTLAAAVDNIAIDCVAAVDVSVTVSGLTAAEASGLVLQNNGGDNLSFNADGTSSFPPMPNGDPYTVTILFQPIGATCSVTDGAGTATADINVAVICEQVFRIGGTTTGLNAGNSVTLELSGGGTLILSDNGSFTFPGFFATGSSVSLLSTEFELADERCTVAVPTEQVGTADVLDLAVTCVDTFVVGGTLTAPAAASVTISTTNQRGTDTVTVPGDAGPFVFTRRFALDEQYAVLASGTDLQCTVTKGAGTVAGAVDDIAVSCVELVDVAVTVTGLTADAAVGLELQNNGGDPLVIDDDGTYPFPALPAGSTYDITILQQPVGAFCTVSDGTGTATTDVNVTVDCEQTFRIGGTVTGLEPGNQLQLTLEVAPQEPATITQNGTFEFPPSFLTGTSVLLTAVVIDVANQRCFVDVPTASITNADVLDLLVTCVDTVEVGGTITAPSFSAVTVNNLVTGDTVSATLEATSFTFPRRFAIGETYEVVATATSADCTVQNGGGVVAGPVSEIAVTCTLAPINLQLVNPSLPADALPVGVDLSNVEYNVALAQPFASFYGTPERAVVRDGSDVEVASGTWALTDGPNGQQVRITFAPTAGNQTVTLPNTGDHRIQLTSTFALNNEAAEERVFAQTSAQQPLRVLPLGLSSLSPNTVQQGDQTVILGAGMPLFSDALFMFRRGEPTAAQLRFRGLLVGGCVNRTPAGCLVQSAPFTVQDHPAGTYDVCVVAGSGIDVNDPQTWPVACPAASSTSTGPVELTISGCGDGVVAGNEGCDDGNVVDLDGCSNACVVESTYSCSGQPSVCEQLFGDGRDGPLTVTTASSMDEVSSNGRTCPDAFSANVIAVNAPTGVTLATAPAAGCLAAGDVVLLVNLQGRASIVTNVGNHERLTVATVDSATVTFNESIQQFYGNAANSNAGIGTQAVEQRVILQRVPQYTTVTVADELTPAAWDGLVGGVLAFEAGDGVIVEDGGSIHADGKGYRGAGSPTLTLASGRPGEGPGGYAVPYLAAANTAVLTGTNLSAGNGAGITVDRDGNLYVVENAAGRRVRKVTATGTITTIIADDNDPGNGVELVGGADVEVDEQGFLYVADGNGLLGTGGDRILRVDLTANPPTVSTLVSNVTNPMGLAVLGDTLFVATFGNSTAQTAGQLLMYDASDGQFLATVSSNLGVLATDVEIGPDGNFYIAGLATNAASNGHNNVVKRVSLVTGSVDDFVDIGLSDPVSLAFDGIGDLWVNFAFSNRLARIRDGNRSDRFLSGDFDGSGAIDNGEATDAGNGLAIDVDGALYTYLNSNVVRKITGPISVEGGGPVALAAPEASGGTGGGGNQCAPEYGFGVAGGGGGHADSGADPLHVAKSELSVQNAGFEQPTVAAGEAGAAGDISGWSTVVNSQQTTVGVYRPAAGENIVPADGSQVAYLNAGNPGARLQQTLSTTLGFGTRVVVSGRLILRPNHAPAPVSVFVNGVEHVLPAPMAGAGRPFSVTVDVLRGSPLNGQQLSVEFIAGNSGVQTLLDGVTIAVSDRCGGRGGPAYGTMNHLAFGAGGGSGGNDDALHDNPAGGAGGAGGGIVSIRAPSIEIQTGGSISARGAAGIGDAPGCDGSGTSADPNPCYDFSGPGGGGAGGTVRLDTNQLLGAPSVDGGTGGHGTPGAAGVGGAGAPGFLVDRGSPGVLAEFFSGSIQTLDSFGSLTPMAAPAPAVRTSTPFALIGGDNFGARFTALIDIPTSGLWTFATTSDDGSRLFIDDALVVDNDGLHGPDLRTGSVNLSAGLHSFEVQFFELGGGEFLQVSWQEPGQSTLVDIPVSAFSQPLGASVPPT